MMNAVFILLLSVTCSKFLHVNFVQNRNKLPDMDTFSQTDPYVVVMVFRADGSILGQKKSQTKNEGVWPGQTWGNDNGDFLLIPDLPEHFYLQFFFYDEDDGLNFGDDFIGATFPIPHGGKCIKPWSYYIYSESENEILELYSTQYKYNDITSSSTHIGQIIVDYIIGCKADEYNPAKCGSSNDVCNVNKGECCGISPTDINDPPSCSRTSEICGDEKYIYDGFPICKNSNRICNIGDGECCNGLDYCGITNTDCDYKRKYGYPVCKLSNRVCNVNAGECCSYLGSCGTTADHCDVNRKYGKSCDWGCYLARYQDLKNAFGEDKGAASSHYWTFGKAEGRDCSC
jgi:hypothetical protein